MSCKLVTCSSDDDSGSSPSQSVIFNNEVNVSCTGGLSQCSIPPSYPSGITFNSISNVVVVAAGIFSAATQAAADALATAYGQNFISNEVVAGRMVCGGSCLFVIILPDQETTSLLSETCENIKYLNGELFYNSYSDTKIYGSTDGLSWSNLKSTTTVQYDSTYGLGLYVTAGARSGGTNHYYTSPDAITWTERTFNFSGSVTFCICFGSGRFIVGTGNGRYFYGTDGINWTDGGRIDAASTQQFYRISFLNSLFWAIANISGKVYSSPDGLVWTLRGTFSSPSDITYGGGIYALSANGNVYTSPDGIVWTPQAYPAGRQCTCIAYGNGIFMSGGGNGATKEIFYSTDCINWTQWSVTPAHPPSSAIYIGGGKFVIAEG